MVMVNSNTKGLTTNIFEKCTQKEIYTKVRFCDTAIFCAA